MVNLLKVSKHCIGHLNNSWKNIEGREIWHTNILSWTSSMIVSTIKYFQTWENYLKLDKEDNIMSYAWVYLYRSYIVMDPLTCGACYLESFASQNICTKREYCLCIQNPWTKFLPWVSTISTYMRYLPAVPSKFACAKL